MKLAENIRGEFTEYRNQATEEDIYKEFHEDAYAEFERLGFPSVKQEEWKYTNLRPLAEKDFGLVAHAGNASAELLKNSISASVKANRIVFVNGYFNESLSTFLETDKSILLLSIHEAIRSKNAMFAAHFGNYVTFKDSSLNALNTAMPTGGLFLYVPDNTQVKYPVSIINLTEATEKSVFAQPRNLIVIGKNSSLVLIESYYATGVKSAFTNAVNEVVVGEGANLEYYKIQRQTGESYQNNYTQIYQKANSKINHVTLTLDGSIVRNNLHFYMDGENCNSLLYGLYLTDGAQHIDNHTRVDHAKPNSFSDEKYKGILKDKSTAVFNGKIVVHLDAQKTNAYQRNQNILLSDDATVNTKPQLEIFADDVKCTHGATIGQLDEEPMFYLRSRGISEDMARKMLLTAFAEDIAEKIKIPEMVALMEEQITQKL